MQLWRTVYSENRSGHRLALAHSLASSQRREWEISQSYWAHAEHGSFSGFQDFHRKCGHHMQVCLNFVLMFPVQLLTLILTWHIMNYCIYQISPYKIKTYHTKLFLLPTQLILLWFISKVKTIKMPFLFNSSCKIDFSKSNLVLCFPFIHFRNMHGTHK